MGCLAARTVAALEANLGKTDLGRGRHELALPVRFQEGGPAFLASAGMFDQRQALLGIEEAVQVIEQLRLKLVTASHGGLPRCPGLLPVSR